MTRALIAVLAACGSHPTPAPAPQKQVTIGELSAAARDALCKDIERRLPPPDVMVRAGCLADAVSAAAEAPAGELRARCKQTLDACIATTAPEPGLPRRCIAEGLAERCPAITVDALNACLAETWKMLDKHASWDACSALEPGDTTLSRLAAERKLAACAPIEQCSK